MSVEMDVEYHEKRLTYLPYKYRLERRSFEVIRALTKYYEPNLNSLLDIGTADGLMLNRISEEIPIQLLVGIDFSFSLLKKNESNHLRLLNANAIDLPFRDEIFDAVIAIAVIEHIHDGDSMLKECHRVLRKGGVCVLTTPDPFFDKIAILLGQESKEEHVNPLNLNGLKSLLSRNGFRVLEATKFMMSPVGFPFEHRIEKLMKLLGLNFLLLNQLIVARKVSKAGG